MNILIPQGSPRVNGDTAWMAEEYYKAAEVAGRKVTLVDVAHKKIAGCMACEEEHVALYMEYDKCIEEFKRRVERICACKKAAEEEKQRALDWLNARARHYREQNELLDKPGGPHGH